MVKDGNTNERDNKMKDRKLKKEDYTELKKLGFYFKIRKEGKHVSATITGRGNPYN